MRYVTIMEEKSELCKYRNYLLFQLKLCSHSFLLDISCFRNRDKLSLKPLADPSALSLVMSIA